MHPVALVCTHGFADVLTLGVPPLVTLPEARRAIGILDAARRSAESGTRIPVDFGPA